MADGIKISFRNKILADLPAREFGKIETHLRAARLVSKQTLHEPNEHISEVFFLEDGLASVMATTAASQKKVEVGLIGFEGMTGITTMLGQQAMTFNAVIVQTAGTAFRMSTDALHGCLPETPVLRNRLSCAFEIFIAQISQTAACNIQHTLPQRLARWLLAADDRTWGNELPLTHELLSVMLGVRRASVTLGVEFFETAGFIQTARGQITIKVRAGLEEFTCVCHERLQEFSKVVSNQPVSRLARHVA